MPGSGAAQQRAEAVGTARGDEVARKIDEAALRALRVANARGRVGIGAVGSGHCGCGARWGQRSAQQRRLPPCPDRGDDGSCARRGGDVPGATCEQQQFRVARSRTVGDRRDRIRERFVIDAALFERRRAAAIAAAVSRENRRTPRGAPDSGDDGAHVEPRWRARLTDRAPTPRSIARRWWPSRTAGRGRRCRGGARSTRNRSRRPRRCRRLPARRAREPASRAPNTGSR